MRIILKIQNYEQDERCHCGKHRSIQGCQLCIVACPKDVIALAQKRVNVHGYPYTESARPDDCIGCAACATVCPDGYHSLS